MKKGLKIAGIVAAALAAVLVGLTLFVRSYLTDERIRMLVTEAAESSLGRKVSLGEISVGIFKGISVRDFEIREKDSDAAFLKAESFILKYQLLPLLSKRLVIDELGLVSPLLVVTKKGDGTYNFSDIVQPKAGEDSTEKPGDASGLPVSLSIHSMRIEKGKLEYSDEAGGLRKALIGLDAELSLQAKSASVISSSGKTSLRIGELVLKDRPHPVRDIPVGIRYEAEVDIARRTIELRDGAVDAFSIAATLKGRLKYGEPFSYQFEMSAPAVKLTEVQKAASPLLPQGVGLDGGLSVRIAVEQTPIEKAKPSLSGEIQLKDVSVQAKGMKPVFSGTIALAPDRIGLQSVKLLAGDSTADISGQILNYATAPDIRLDIASRMLNLDSVMPAAAAAAQSAPAGTPSAKGKAQEEFGPFMTKVKMGGTLDIERLLMKGVTMQNVKARYEFRDNVFTLSTLTGSTLSGSFSARGSVDLSKKGTTYTLNAETNGVKLEEITAAFAPKAKENLFGSLSGRAEISGAGSTRETIKRNLRGRGGFAVKNGTIRNAQISDGLLALLGLQSMKEIPMEKAEGSFTISDSVMHLKSIIANRDLVLDETGTIGLDQKLDMAILVKVSDNLSPRMVSQSGIAQFLSEEKGWTSVPLKLTGTIAKPSYGIDTQAVGKKATQKIQQRLGDELMKALSGEKDTKRDTNQPQQEQQAPGREKKGVSPEDLLKGLFR